MDGQQPVMIFGRVTRGDGSPLPGAALTLCDLAGDQLDRGATDDSGHYQLVPPTGGTYLVICSSSTHRPKASLVAVSDRPLQHDVALAGGGATLQGTVGTRRDGAVAGTADVVLTLTDVRGTVVAVARSDADGGYRFADLGEGTYTLTAAVADAAPIAETVQVSGEDRITRDIALVTQLRLSGVVTSASGGRPVPEALATLVGADGNVVGAAVTDGDGAFAFPEVTPGTYTITASGYAPVASEIEIGTGHPAEVTLTLTPPTVGPEGEDGPVDRTDHAGTGRPDDGAWGFDGRWGHDGGPGHDGSHEAYGSDAVPAGVGPANGHNGRHAVSPTPDRHPGGSADGTADRGVPAGGEDPQR